MKYHFLKIKILFFFYKIPLFKNKDFVFFLNKIPLFKNTTLKRPVSNIDAMWSFVSVLNHRFCLNSASDWSVIFTLSRCLKIPSAFSPMNLKSLSK